jgi:hypothetical protein
MENFTFEAFGWHLLRFGGIDQIIRNALLLLPGLPGGRASYAGQSVQAEGRSRSSTDRAGGLDEWIKSATPHRE